MAKIAVLPAIVVNKIAAGEVIERPASVAKELLENAVDSGADRIVMTFEEGGKQLISVVDNGEGMDEDDLRLAVLPHATSKIKGADDLFAVRTLGFRGEALASIGAVSRLRIVSRRHEAVCGAEITVAAEEVQSRQAAGSPPGTTVEVRDLFFNIPVRRKFLKSTNTEVGHLTEQFARVALAHRRIEFRLFNGKREVYHFPAHHSLVERLRSFYGDAVAAELIPIDRTERGIRISGCVAPPAQSRSSGKWQYVFVNGRYVQDKFIQHAVKEAYRGLMEHDRYPVVFLFLEVDPGSVDVNVHPTKSEVRWEDSNKIHSQVLSALRETFLRRDLTPRLRTPAAPNPEVVEKQNRIREAVAEFYKQAPPVQGHLDFGGVEAASRPAASVAAASADPVEAASRRFPPGGTSPPYEDLSAVEAASDTPVEAASRRFPLGAIPPPYEDPAAFGSAAPAGLGISPTAKAIQIHNTYLVVESEEGIVVIDQHALHERILYDQFKNRLTRGNLESQRFLLPETVELSPEQIAALDGNGELLERLGLELTPFGPNSVAVQSFPVLLEGVPPGEFVRDLADKLCEKGRQLHTEVVIHELLDMMACKAAVKAGDPLTDQEIASLVARKELVEKSSNCPHGRPTTLRLSIKELEKQFKRT